MIVHWRLWILAPMVWFLAGCLEIDQQLTINPDRSAKIRVRMTFDLGLLRQVESTAGIDMQQEILEAEETMRSLAAQCMATAKGVEAWTDYGLSREEKDRITVAMTAYARDVTRFELNPDSGEIPGMTFSVTTGPEGEDQWLMQMRGVNDRPRVVAPPKLAADEVAEMVAERRLEFEEESRESKVLFEALKITSSLRFPGKILSTTNAKKTSRHEARIRFEGKRFYAMMESIFADEDLVARVLGQGADLHADLALPGPEVNAWLFGEKAPVAISVSSGKRPLFPYAREVARAKENPVRLELQRGAGE